MAARDVKDEEAILKRDSISTEEGAVLTNLWRRVLRGRNMIPYRKQIITSYVSNKGNLAFGEKKPKKKSTIENNFFSESMSWRVFLDLMFNVLRVKKIRIRFDLKHSDNSESSHFISATPNTYAKENIKFADEIIAERKLMESRDGKQD